MSAHQNSPTDDDRLCCSAGDLCEERQTLSCAGLESFVTAHDIDLSDTETLQFDARDPRAGTIEARHSDEYDAADPGGSGQMLDESYPVASDTVESNIRAALVDEINDETAVDTVLTPLRNWKHGSYTIHTPEALPEDLRPNDPDDAYAHYAQTHELVCKEALSIDAPARNDTLDGDDPSSEEVRTLQYIHGLSRYFLREHLSADGSFTLYRGVGGVALADVGRQLIDDEDPPLEVDEKAAIANFSPSKDVAESFRGLILSVSVPPDAVAVAADQLFKCTDEHGEVTNCHAEVRVVTDCYRGSTSFDDLRLPSNTNAQEFLQDPHTDDLEDHRFMASLLSRWFDEYDSSEDRPIPQTATGFHRIEEWHAQYQALLETRQQEALEQEDFELADRLGERLTIVDGLTKTAEAVRDNQGL